MPSELSPLKEEKESSLSSFKASVHSLLRSPRDYWLSLVIKTFYFIGIGSNMLTLSLYFTEVKGFSDTLAGVVVGTVLMHHG